MRRHFTSFTTPAAGNLIDEAGVVYAALIRTPSD
jgi:hypothetical protein